MRVSVVIPTYWTRPVGEPPQRGDAIFDHPTPVDGESTLPRLLESIAEAERPFPCDVLILVGYVHPELASAADARVRAMVDAFSDRLTISYVGSLLFSMLGEAVEAAGLPTGTVTPLTYAGVRNAQLILPYLQGADIIVALDDDEVIPPDYFLTLKETLDERPEKGFAGLYQDPHGHVLIDAGPMQGNIFMDKAAIMNTAITRLLIQSDRWVTTPIAFGGNMIFRREMVETVGFDPGITRGEDIDYVLNATLMGQPFVLDTALRIIHIPPREYDTHPYAKLAQDVRRFMYEREKLRVAQEHGLPVPKPAQLLPYPGRFLMVDLEEHALAALRALATDEVVRIWGTPEEIVVQAQERAHELAPQFLAFLQTWPQALAFIKDRAHSMLSRPNTS